MYQPSAFRIDDTSRLHGLIRANALGLLVAAVDGALEASHVPMVLDAAPGERGSLAFHLARANPLACALDGTREALVVFQGEASYVSPDWYRSAHMVPTWNYAAVHAYGTPRALDDAALASLLDDLSAQQEARLPKPPWTTDKLPEDLYARMRAAVTGFRMPISRLLGKWKMGQNRSDEDRRGVIAGLAGLGTPDALQTARVMGELLGS